MLRLEVLRAQVTVKDLPKVRAYIADLASEWRGVVGAAQHAQREALGLDEKWENWGVQPSTQSAIFSDLRVLLAAEYFVVPHGAVAVVLEGDTRGMGMRFFRSDGDLDPSLVTDAHLEVALLVDDEYDLYRSRIVTAAKAHVKVDLETRHVSNKQFEDLRTELVSEEIPSSPEILRVARALSPKKSRELAIAIKSARGLLAGDVEKRPGLTKQKAKSLLAGLAEAGVISSEIVVVCGATGNQVARVSDANQLDALGKQGLRCGCGKPIGEERPDTLYSITDEGATMIDKSRWMSVLVREGLVQMGVPPTDVLLECLVGSDEIDCLALVSGQIVIFELKDKEFSLGNAYSFGAKISIVQPSHAVIVTTEHIPEAVREHFNRTQSIRGVRDRGDRKEFHYVAGETFLDQLGPVVAALYRAKTSQMLGNVFSLSSPRATAVIDALEATRR